ncbi:MAG: hypothetical protein K8R48_00725 [Alphaproteobacteria bacterium]|nr:hypothetical protein [Alphaproteobacteria bacterium]
MKKIAIILAVLLSCAIAAISWHNFPWSWVIDRRVADSGPGKLIADFDGWHQHLDKNASMIEVLDLPASFQALKPMRAFHRDKGLYLVLKSGFVNEEGVFLASPGNQPDTSTGTDPSFVPLGERVYRYHFRG